MCKSNDAIYGLGFIGALVYNIQYANGVGEVLWGIFKSMVWPAFLIYDVLTKLPV